jgi:hypothetical protein
MIHASRSVGAVQSTNGLIPAAELPAGMGAGTMPDLRQVVPGVPLPYAPIPAPPPSLMDTYRSVVAAHLYAGQRSDTTIASLDEQAVEPLVQYLNHRHPGMNLALAKNLHERRPVMRRSIFSHRRRIIFNHCGSEPLQHFLADLQVRPGKPASIVIIEPASLHDDAIFRSFQRFGTAIRKAAIFADARLTLIGADLQRNPCDNLLLTLASAKCAYEHRAEISTWHDAQHEGELIEDDGNDPLANLPPGALRDTSEFWTRRYVELGYRLCSAVQLPPAFIQHAQDADVLMAHLLAVPESDDAGRALLGKNLGDLYINRGEPLSIERWRAELVEATLADLSNL